MVRYLTGVSNAAVKAVAHREQIGLLCQPGNGYAAQISSFPFWAADNGCFGKHAARFDAAAWFAWLERNRGRASSCLFATAPDVVGDAVKTLERSRPWLAKIRALGYKAAFVAQDGIERTEIPWDEFDVLFLGGSTEFKLGDVARRVTAEAKRRGKAVHMGRVNSGRRLRIADSFGCDTADGTFLAFGPELNLPRLLRWLAEVNPFPPAIPAAA